MRKALFALAVLVLMAAAVCNAVSFSLAGDQEYDVRKVRWHMKPSEVVESEGRKPDQVIETGGYVYFDSLFGEKVAIIYSFDNIKGLNEVMFYFTDTSKYNAKKIYNMIVERLDKRFSVKELGAASQVTKDFFRIYENNRMSVSIINKDDKIFVTYIEILLFHQKKKAREMEEEMRKKDEEKNLHQF